MIINTRVINKIKGQAPTDKNENTNKTMFEPVLIVQDIIFQLFPIMINVINLSFNQVL